MKAILLHAIATAIIAAPIGWILAGVLAALADPLGRAVHILYVPGDHSEAAALAACLSFVASWLILFARRSSRRAPAC